MKFSEHFSDWLTKRNMASNATRPHAILGEMRINDGYDLQQCVYEPRHNQFFRCGLSQKNLFFSTGFNTTTDECSCSSGNSCLENLPPFTRLSTMERTNQLDMFTNLLVQSTTSREWPTLAESREKDRCFHGRLKDFCSHVFVKNPAEWILSWTENK